MWLRLELWYVIFNDIATLSLSRARACTRVHTHIFVHLG